MTMKKNHKTNEHETNNYNAHIQNPFVKLKCPFISISKFYNFKTIALLWLLKKKLRWLQQLQNHKSTTKLNSTKMEDGGKNN
jgi:hypothetical protein